MSISSRKVSEFLDAVKERDRETTGDWEYAPTAFYNDIRNASKDWAPAWVEAMRRAEQELSGIRLYARKGGLPSDVVKRSFVELARCVAIGGVLWEEAQQLAMGMEGADT